MDKIQPIQNIHFGSNMTQEQKDRFLSMKNPFTRQVSISGEHIESKPASDFPSPDDSVRFIA
jgi:hypothetical protein